ncbi:hypothetical protein [Rhodomicrobium lacus]|jgi:hypothetical protein|uniref:hypothetical protein n=1 Tax=Rhodomicrobium TaxID=1068 RepID=UPI000F8CB7C7|nr:hypothetical protein [Rhodomicrobium lacus]WKW50681.1 hypothetical protein QMO75_15630 [Rhodomicrobium lacus]
MSLRISAFADEVGFHVHSTRSSVNKYAIDADAWIEGATAAGWMPHLRQRPLSAGYVAGEWQIATLKNANTVSYPGPIPEALWDDVFIGLGSRGLVRAQPDLRVWNGDVLPDVLSPGAVLVRLSLLRAAAAQPAAMALDISSLQARLAKSAASRKLELDELMIELLERYAERAGIPEHWLIWGIAEEL